MEENAEKMNRNYLCSVESSVYIFNLEKVKRVPGAAKRSKQSTLKEINPEYSLEGPMLKMKLQYFGHLIQTDNSLEKSLMLGKIEGKRRRGHQREMAGWHFWCNGHEPGQTLGDGKGQRSLECCSPWDLRVRHNWVTEQQQQQLEQD